MNRKERKELKSARGLPSWAKSPEQSTKKKEKRTKLRVTVFPPGGNAYPEDVESDETGRFKLEGLDGQHKIAKGSVWKDPDGLMRALVRTDLVETINIRSLNNDPIMDPESYNWDLENGLSRDLMAWSNKGKWWQNGHAWGNVFLLLAIAGLLFWHVKVTGDMGEAIREMGQALVDAWRNGPGSTSSGGMHQNISPGGS